jgi:hypothetical protein
MADASEPTPLDHSDYSTPERAAEILQGFWPLERDLSKLWEVLSKKQAEYYAAAERRGLFQMCRLAFDMYYGTSGAGNGSFSTQSIRFSGDDGELLECPINEFASYADQIIGLVTKNRPAFEAQALNTDSTTLGQIESADTLIGALYEQELGEQREKEAVKAERLFGKSFIYTDWDPSGGRSVDVEEEYETEHGPIAVDAQEPAGEFVIQRRNWWEVVGEHNKSELDRHAWRLIVEPRATKQEMVARYPLFAQRIMDSQDQTTRYQQQFPGYDSGAHEAEDACSVFTFYYARNPACPTGRRVRFVNDVGVEDEFRLPIGEIPVAPLMACELLGTCFGVSTLWNIIPGEQLKHQVLSDIATNIEAFGRPPLIVDDQADFSLESLANGQVVLPVPRDARQPEALKYPSIPDASFKVLDLLKQLTQSQTALNAIARGDTSNAITSGAYAALYVQSAVEAQSPLQAGLDLLRERIANMMLAYLKAYATHPQIVAIAGLDERAYLQGVDKSRVSGIETVRMKTSNPMLRNTAGRMQVAELLRQWPDVDLKANQVIELVTSGQIKPLYVGARASELHIRRENELLLKGPPVSQVPDGVDPMTGQPKFKSVVEGLEALMVENVKDHVQGHLEVLYSPASEQNPAVKAAVQAHIIEHFQIARNADPYAAMVLGIPGPQQAMQADPGAKEGGDSGSTDKAAQGALTPPDEKNDRAASLPTAAKPPTP